MKFIHSDLGSLRRGDIVEVTLRGAAANVMLLDSSNFNAYRSGRNFRYAGGLARKSPVRLSVRRQGTGTEWSTCVVYGGRPMPHSE